ncbi:MAG: dihydroorotate dehydrogenase electron transfer subunit [bacterium]
MTFPACPIAMPRYLKTTIHRLVPLNEKYYLMKIFAPEIVLELSPGMFVMVCCALFDVDPFLPRPYSVCSWDEETLDIFFQVMGKGTKILSGKQSGDPIELFGPFGRHFSPPEECEEGLLVGGGTGIAPLLALARTLTFPFSVIIGGRSESDIFFVEEFSHYAQEVLITTEDGSLGYPGFPTPLVEKWLSQHRGKKIYSAVCGPSAMLKAFLPLWEGVYGTVEYSLEAPMACGTGACLGCLDEIFGIKVCTEGPVIRLKLP